MSVGTQNQALTLHFMSAYISAKDLDCNVLLCNTVSFDNIPSTNDYVPWKRQLFITSIYVTAFLLLKFKDHCSITIVKINPFVNAIISKYNKRFSNTDSNIFSNSFFFQSCFNLLLTFTKTYYLYCTP